MLENLKEEIVKTWQAPINTSKDCNLLSAAISERTGRSISPATLRRFFDLMPSKSSTSKFNLDTLAIFCGYVDYYGFCQQRKEHQANEKPIAANRYLEKLQQLTQYTLHSIEKRCLTDFNFTIPRHELNRKLDAFIDSNDNFFPLIAPGGYGKTIGLAHWVKSLNEQACICLFCQASIFHQLVFKKQAMPSSFNFDPLSDDNIFDFAAKQFEASGKKLIIVIDALDEISRDGKKLQELATSIFNMADLFVHSPYIKIIVSVRESTWENLLLSKEIKPLLNGLSHVFSQVGTNGFTNAPLLTPVEIGGIISRHQVKSAEPIVYECISFELREKLKIPILLHYYLSLHNNKLETTKITPNRLNRAFLDALVFKAAFAEQKEDIIWHLLELMNLKEDFSTIDKNEVKKRYPINLKREMAWHTAYQDLIDYGLLKEERIANKYGIYTTQLSFKHQNFYFHFITNFFIKQHNQITFLLFQKLAISSNSLEWRSNIIANLYSLAYENEELDALINFCDLPKDILSSIQVRFAVGTSFRKTNIITNELISRYAQSTIGRTYFFEQFVDTNYLYPNYTKRIEIYLKYSTSQESRLFAHTILFLSGILKWNIETCKAQFKYIKAIEPDSSIHPWPIGRKVAAHVLHTRLIKKEYDSDLSQFISKYQTIAYKHEGYLKFGLAAFELPICVALILVNEYSALKFMLERAIDTYHIENPTDAFYSILSDNQNPLLPLFLEFSKFKLNEKHSDSLICNIEENIISFCSAYDDFQYQILLNWMLFDLYTAENNTTKAYYYQNAAMEISKHAKYDLFTKVFFTQPAPDTIY